MKHVLTLALGLCLVAFAACGDDTPGLDIIEQDIQDIGQDSATLDDVAEDPGTERDTTVPDTNVPDTNVPDTNVPDTNVPDTNVPDTNVPDTNPEDLGVEDPGQDPDVTPGDTNIKDTNIEDIEPVDVTPEDVTAEVEEDVVVDTFEPECDSDDDCLIYGEQTDCAWWRCDTQAGLCVEELAETGATCSDGDFCTGPDYCEAGSCMTGPAIDCDDTNACTIDTCETAIGCVNTPDLTITAVLTCGTGVCYNEIEQCTEGAENVCVPGEGRAETCDGMDEDCDGETDNGNPGGGLACASDLLGPCLEGTTACEGGMSVCVPNILPEPEKCDKVDNDCDGNIDNDPVSSGMPCAVSGQLGACAVGRTGCTNGLITCVQTVFPESELCDGVDNDCDNDIDEGNPGGGVPCATGLQGVCNEGITSCATGSMVCQQTGFPGSEICDGLDNDCDGVTDPANTTGCTVYYRDQDNDGYGMSESRCVCAPTAPYTATNTSDCCDTDPLANPGGTTFRTAPNQCGSYDFNCDGANTRQYVYGDGSCGGLLVCKQDMVEGWKGAAPNCGQTGVFLENCTFEFGIPPECIETTKNLTQGCY